jgi:hypothetical protein
MIGADTKSGPIIFVKVVVVSGTTGLVLMAPRIATIGGI